MQPRSVFLLTRTYKYSYTPQHTHRPTIAHMWHPCTPTQAHTHAHPHKHTHTHTHTHSLTHMHTLAHPPSQNPQSYFFCFSFFLEHHKMRNLSINWTPFAIEGKRQRKKDREREREREREQERKSTSLVQDLDRWL